MVPGVAVTLPGAIVRVCATELPHDEVALTLMVPDVVPAVITLMVLVVELPVHPGGNVHVYVVPGTLGTL